MKLLFQIRDGKLSHCTLLNKERRESNYMKAGAV